MKKVVIIGASGFVGSAILSEALERGFRVTAIVRHPEKMTVRRPELEVVSGDASDRQFLAGAVSGSDAVISAYNPGWRNPDIYREKELDWVFFSPAANLVPGERTRKFRLGKDDLIRSVSGESRISVEDYAVAMIDELEKEMHHRERFTIGY